LELTPAQRKFLTAYRDARLKPKSLAGQLKPALPRLLLLLALATILCYTATPMVACFFVGFIVGGVVRHVAIVVQARRHLPAVLDIIDWPRVDRMLDGTEKANDSDVS